MTIYSSATAAKIGETFAGDFIPFFATIAEWSPPLLQSAKQVVAVATS
jgi:hypothetical protein